MKHEQWLKILLHTRLPHNEAKLLSYFLKQGVEDQKNFFVFVRDYVEGFVHTNSKVGAKRYLKILSPLCDRLGMMQLKKQADVQAFMILFPRQYERLCAEIKTALPKYEKMSECFIKELKKLLKEYGFQGRVFSRIKNIYSLFCKLQNTQKDISQIRDIVAFRIILEDSNPRACFACMNALHDRFRPSVKNFKDYISIPKINGYQSIHTTLVYLYEDTYFPLEVQIRNRTMHDKAEKWVGSHFLYKYARPNESVDQRLVLARLIGENKQARRSIWVLTHQGDLLSLPANSKVSDFARAIHSGLLKRAEKARINGKIQALDTPLREGDIIEIITWSSYAKKK